MVNSARVSELLAMQRAERARAFDRLGAHHILILGKELGLIKKPERGERPDARQNIKAEVRKALGL